MGQISAWLRRCVDGRRLLNPFVPRVCLCAADSTGTHSLYTRYQDYEIMFHVSTMLPYTANNTQQVQSTSSSALVLQLEVVCRLVCSFVLRHQFFSSVSLLSPAKHPALPGLCVFTLPCFWVKGSIEKPLCFCSEHDIKNSAP